MMSLSQTPLSLEEVRSHLRRRKVIKKDDLTGFDKARLESLYRTTKEWVKEIPFIIDQKLDEIMDILNISGGHKDKLRMSLDVTKDFDQWFERLRKKEWYVGLFDFEELYFCDLEQDDPAIVEEEMYHSWNNDAMSAVRERYTGTKALNPFWKDLRDRFKKSDKKFEVALNELREENKIELPTDMNTFQRRIELVIGFEDNITKLVTLFQDYQFVVNSWNKYGATWVEELDEEVLGDIGLSENEVLQLREHLLRNALDRKGLESKLFEISRTSGRGKDLFKDLYLIFIGKEQGPRLAPYLCKFPKEQLLDRLNEVLDHIQGR